MQSIVTAIEYYLPPHVLTNERLAAESPNWTAQKIESKTGIVERRVCGDDECASDLAFSAARRLFDSGVCRPDDIDFLLLCTQSPDYFLPTTACLLQERLGLRTDVGALDFNLGCSGFVYGLGLARGLIETGQARSVLLLTAETYSKFIEDRDFNVRSLFGDAAAATLVQGDETGGGLSGGRIGRLVYGTDGRGAKHLMVEQGGMRARPESNGPAAPDRRRPGRLFMDGPQVFSFTLNEVPKLVAAVLERSDLSQDDIQLFVFHQANQYMLDHLRQKLNIPPERFCVALRESGNTVSSTIPIALKQALQEAQIHCGDAVLLAGFGVGYSWAGTVLHWQ